MKIENYKLIKPVKIGRLLEDGFEYSIDCTYLVKQIQLKDDISLSIKVRLKDYSTQIEVLDDDWCQYYIPFYEYKDNKIESFKILKQVIERYHSEMEDMNSFERA